ncbi:LOW QUALITY PROTEIN: hypothetical protein HZS_5206 [Henneguya salminicola]|nr:LOW QUALITY PROTEIN: hypothetical protein HZS_5206 [Henneguya salminicola]
MVSLFLSTGFIQFNIAPNFRKYLNLTHFCIELNITFATHTLISLVFISEILKLPFVKSFICLQDDSVLPQFFTSMSQESFNEYIYF